jgi:hypothetical protein
MSLSQKCVVMGQQALLLYFDAWPPSEVVKLRFCDSTMDMSLGLCAYFYELI